MGIPLEKARANLLEPFMLYLAPAIYDLEKLRVYFGVLNDSPYCAILPLRGLL